MASKSYPWYKTSAGRAIQEQMEVEKAALHKCHTPGCTHQTTNYYCSDCRYKRAHDNGGEYISSYDPLNS